MPPKPRPPVPTHFLCIPLVSTHSRPQLATSLASFRADACRPPASNDTTDFGGFGQPLLPLIPEDAVRPVGTLHLTLGVFSFAGARERGQRNGEGSTEGQGQGQGQRIGEGRQDGPGSSRVRDAEGKREGRAGGLEGATSMDGDAAAAAGDGAGLVEGANKPNLKPKPTLDQAKEVLNGLNLREIWRAVMANAPVMPGTETPAAQANAGGEDDLEPPKITLRGLASMQVPTKAAVLYAPPVDPLGLLQAFCERVRDAFMQAELMVDDGRPLLLHATVVNTVYSKQKGLINATEGQVGTGGRRKGGRGGGRGGRGGRDWGKRERLVFDGSGLIDRYEDHVWMEDVPLEKVAICKMGAKKVAVDGVEDEAYEVEAEVAF